MTIVKPTYEELNRELESIITLLQQDDTDIDIAVKQYQRGLELTKQIEHYLTEASNSITELKASYSES